MRGDPVRRHGGRAERTGGGQRDETAPEVHRDRRARGKAHGPHQRGRPEPGAKADQRSARADRGARSEGEDRPRGAHHSAALAAPGARAT
jgi:hypothetical protein